jgi:CheY-like chemotaxis protein
VKTLTDPRARLVDFRACWTTSVGPFEGAARRPGVLIGERPELDPRWASARGEPSSPLGLRVHERLGVSSGSTLGARGQLPHLGLDSPLLATENDRVAELARIRVLVADDDPDFLATVRTILDFDQRLELVAEAHDGGQAVKLADELSPDVVAMDVAMPGMDGIEAANLIRAGRPDCRVVLVSGSIFEGRTSREGPELAHEAGAADYVVKSRAVLELGDALVSAVRSPAAPFSSEETPGR